MPVNLALYAPSERAANTAAEAAFARIAQLDGILSDYKPDSELSRLSATTGSGREVPISPDLWRVLAASQDLAERTDGAFDVTVGPLVKLWRRARRIKEMPSPQRLSQARAAVDSKSLILDAAKHTARLEKPGMRLDLGGIAAGYVVDEALATLRKHAVSRAMVDASGDIAVGDPPPDTRGWRIGVASASPDGPPTRYLELSNCAISTAGDAFQFVELEGRRYSHIVDPHTGLGLTDRWNVTVVAPNCLAADGLDTALSVLGPKRGIELADREEGVAALYFREVDGKFETAASQGWSMLRETEAAAQHR